MPRLAAKTGEVSTLRLSQLLMLGYYTLAVSSDSPVEIMQADMVVVNRDQIRFSPFWENMENV